MLIDQILTHVQSELLKRGITTQAHIDILIKQKEMKEEKEMFYLTMHSTHYVYGDIALDIS